MEQLKVYLDGTMIAFTTVDDKPLQSYPRGWVVLEPLGTTGFTFLDADSNKTLYQVNGLDNILDITGTPYGVTQLDVFTALNAFLGFNSGGGGGVTGAENATFVSGGNVRLGGPLIQNTSITEDGFDFTADKTEEPNPGYGNVTTYYKSEIGQPLPNVFPVNSLNRKIGILDNLGDAEIGVFGDNYYEAVAYWKANSGPEENIAYSSGNSFNIKQYLSGVQRAFFLLNSNLLNIAHGTNLIALIHDGAMSLIALNNTLNTDFSDHNQILRTPAGAQHAYLEIPIEETIAPGATYTYSKLVNNNKFTKVVFEGTYIEGGKTGFGTIETRGGVGKVNISPAVAVASTEDIRSTAGMSSVTTVVNVSGANLQWQITNNSIEDNVKVSGIIRIFERITTVS